MIWLTDLEGKNAHFAIRKFMKKEIVVHVNSLKKEMLKGEDTLAMAIALAKYERKKKMLNTTEQKVKVKEFYYSQHHERYMKEISIVFLDKHKRSTNRFPKGYDKSLVKEFKEHLEKVNPTVIYLLD